MSLSNKPRGIYRSRSGLIMGVCKGIAQYFDINVGVIRFIAVVLLLVTGFWPITGMYLLIGFLLKPEPSMPFRDHAEQEFYNDYTTKRRIALFKLKRKFENLDSRVRFMESVVTSKDFEWRDKFDKQ
jgi:phage shock protein C